MIELVYIPEDMVDGSWKHVEKDVADYMKQNNLEITIEINNGNKNFTCYTMDFTQKYITINSDYRS